MAYVVVYTVVVVDGLAVVWCCWSVRRRALALVVGFSWCDCAHPDCLKKWIFTMDTSWIDAEIMLSSAVDAASKLIGATGR